MAHINVDNAEGASKRPVDTDINLIPMIDLLLCCVMFLLVTAVWNQLARLTADQQNRDSSPAALPTSSIQLVLQVQNHGYTLASTAGDRFEIPKVADRYDLEGLQEKLRDRRRLEPNKRDLIVAPEDGVAYEDIIHAMDTVVGEGFTEMTLSDGSVL
jgi:biopolymer transport protein ExbD